MVKVDTAQVVASEESTYRLMQAIATGGTVIARSTIDTKTAAINSDGSFSLSVKGGAEYKLEASVPDGKGGVTKVVSPDSISVPLAQDPPTIDAASLVTRQTGSIQGLIELKNAKVGETPDGADVYLSGGTSVVGKAGETGRFALINVAEGTWNVVIAKPGFKRQVVKGVEVKAGKPTLLNANIVLEAEPTTSSSSTANSSTISTPQGGVKGIVQTSDGKPIIGATVSVYPKNRKALGDLGFDDFTAVTDEQGQYEILGLPTGDYTVQVYRPFYIVPPRQAITIATGGTKDLGITKISSNIAYFGKVSGQICDDKGQPLESVVAQLDPPVTESQFTDATGKFTLDRVLPGEYKISLSAGGFVTTIIPIAVDNKPNFSVSIPGITSLSRGTSKADPPIIKMPSTAVTVPPTSPLPSKSASPVATLPTPKPSGSSESPNPDGTLRGVVSTLAGGSKGYSDGKGITAAFDGISGLALGPDGNLYVADSGNNVIRKVSPDGVVTTVAGRGVGYANGKGIDAKFNGPSDLAFGPDGNIYVSDTLNNCIRRMSTSGDVTTLAGTLSAGFKDSGPYAVFTTPKGLAFGPDGNLYVADSGNNAIRKITLDGVVTTPISASGAAYRSFANLNEPAKLAVDIKREKIYLSEGFRGRIGMIAGWNLSTLAGSDGDTAGLGFADGTGSEASFGSGGGLAVAPDGSVYVADGRNSRIRRVMPDRLNRGVVTTLAGSTAGFVDGAIAQAKFNAPSAIAVGPDGTIYIGDSNRIRVIR
jgi:sugar lactone lactonase YvrE